jgi:hypothetical protein
MTSNQFTLEDFRNQLGQFKKLGSMSKMMKMLPEQMMGGLQNFRRAIGEVEAQMKRTEAIIDSMTKAERSKIIKSSTRAAKRASPKVRVRRFPKSTAYSPIRADEENDAADESRRTFLETRGQSDGRTRRRFGRT